MTDNEKRLTEALRRRDFKMVELQKELDAARGRLDELVQFETLLQSLQGFFALMFKTKQLN
jgi:hypothetical protein